MLLWIAVLLPSLILATDTNWQYQIYVSSSDGTNSSSCWNGSVSCNTLNLALQGVQHNSTVIYLYPGIYTLDDEVRNISRVAIIGLSNDVTISCHHQPVTGQWLDNVIVCAQSRRSKYIERTLSFNLLQPKITLNCFTKS